MNFGGSGRATWMKRFQGRRDSDPAFSGGLINIGEFEISTDQPIWGSLPLVRNPVSVALPCRTVDPSFFLLPAL